MRHAQAPKRRAVCAEMASVRARRSDVIGACQARLAAARAGEGRTAGAVHAQEEVRERMHLVPLDTSARSVFGGGGREFIKI